MADSEDAQATNPTVEETEDTAENILNENTNGSQEEAQDGTIEEPQQETEEVTEEQKFDNEEAIVTNEKNEEEPTEQNEDEMSDLKYETGIDENPVFEEQSVEKTEEEIINGAKESALVDAPEEMATFDSSRDLGDETEVVQEEVDNKGEQLQEEKQEEIDYEQMRDAEQEKTQEEDLNESNKQLETTDTDKLEHNEAEAEVDEEPEKEEEQIVQEEIGEKEEPFEEVKPAEEEAEGVLPDYQTSLNKETSDVNENADKSSHQRNKSADQIIFTSEDTHMPSNINPSTGLSGTMSTSALNIVWSFGLNRNVPVLNLSDSVRQVIMYSCAHVGIMYDFNNNKQHTLQAHLNPITCSAISHDKRWLVTGDVGQDAMVNIWDTYTGTPIQTMFDPNPKGGVVAVAFTPDSRYLATLSSLPIQTLAIWDWTVDGDVPICSADLKPEYGLQHFIHFDNTDIHHVVTNSETQVLFYHWDETQIKYYAPPLTDSDFKQTVGRYSQSLFQTGIARALTATSIGKLVVWDNNRPLSKILDVSQSADKKPLKIIKVHDKGIHVLTSTESYVVLGDTAGHVKFFDQGLRLIYWYQDIQSGPVTSISFSFMPEFSASIAAENGRYPSDATKKAKPFVVRDFIVGTSIAVYGNMATDGSEFKIIHREHDAAVHALSAHPKLPVIAIASYSGLLKLWNYRTKQVVASRVFEKVHIHTLQFDPKGFYIAVGTTSGSVYLVDSVALLDQLREPYKYAKDTITHIAFSHNSLYFATADASCSVTVYKRQRKEGRNPYFWHGRYRSHYKAIKDMLFGFHLDTNEPKLLTLGEDRMLIEYNLHFAGKTHNHVIPCAEDRIEQSAIPQCMVWYPPITKEHFLFTANDQYKFKCYNSTTKMCRKTVLGPTYGSPVKKMMVVPTQQDETKDRFLAFMTDDKVGLHFLPATGNPHMAMSLIAHPSGVSNLACSFDGAYLFTAGGPDYAVHMWEINIQALEAQAKLGGEDLVPFYGLLEGGRDGQMFEELEGFFYYAQLRHQGINCTEPRSIGNRVPICEVPYIMRAMGYYPSEQEIEDMLNEIKYDDYVSKGQYQEDIDLGQFIKLLVNHRPAFGLSPEQLIWAFHTLSDSMSHKEATNPEQDTEQGSVPKIEMIERGDFLDILTKNGEHMTDAEIADHLTTLLGLNNEGGVMECSRNEAEEMMLMNDNVPYDITADILINEILGFSMTVDPPGDDISKVVVKSSAP